MFTKEQEKISNRNYYKAKKLLNVQKGYVLHHVNPDWKHNDIERYIQWNPEDLEVMKKEDHVRLHHKGKTVSEETRKKISQHEKGKIVSEETRERIRAGSRHLKTRGSTGMHWYNNGIQQITAFNCPEGYVAGRLKLKKYKEHLIHE